MKLPWHERWQTFLVCGLLCAFASPFVLWDLAEWEADPSGGTRSMNWLAVAVYRVGGKWLLAGLVLAGGLLVASVGVRRRGVQRARAGRAQNPTGEGG